MSPLTRLAARPAALPKTENALAQRCVVYMYTLSPEAYGPSGQTESEEQARGPAESA
jgi:hypothetical protein